MKLIIFQDKLEICQNFLFLFCSLNLLRLDGYLLKVRFIIIPEYISALANYDPARLVAFVEILRL